MNVLTRWSRTSSGVLAILLTVPLMLVGCDTTVNNVNSDEPVDPKGSVTGRVVDRVTSEPIQGAEVSLAAPSDTAEDGSSLSATTDAEGTFEINGVPVNTANGSSNSSTTYSLHLTTPSGSPYRPFYRGEVELAFGSGGDDAATNLAASVTLPLSKTNGTVTGRAFTDSGPLNDAEIGFVQTLPVQFDGDGNATQTAEVLTTTATTDSTGTFTLNDVEVGTDFDLAVRIGNSSDVFASGTVPATEDATVQVGETNVTNTVTPFRLTDVSPAPNTDVSTATPTLTFTFNRPVIENEFTREDASGNVDGTLVEELNLSPEIAKDLRRDGNLPIDISFDSTRTKLTVTPSEPLEDGFIYEHDAAGFTDARFTDAYGIPLDNPTVGDFLFSVGLDENPPATPSVSFQSGNKPTLDYDTQTEITAELQVDVDNSEAEVKGYEVFARTVDLTEERTGTGDQFKQITDATDLNPDASSAEFKDANGIIPANEAEFGTLEFSADIDEIFNGDDTPLHADDGTYGAIEWKVRAVSINNVRSDFTSVITTPDNVRPDLRTTQAQGFGNFNRGAYTADDDGDGDEELIVQFDEPVDESTVASDASQFTVYEDGTTNERQGALSGVNRIENKVDPNNDEASVVVIEIDESNYTPTTGDDLVIEDTEADGVTDLAGNPVVENAADTNPIDDDITN